MTAYRNGIDTRIAAAIKKNSTYSGAVATAKVTPLYESENMHANVKKTMLIAL